MPTDVERIDGRSLRTDYRNSGIRNRERAHCLNGHEFSPKNTHWATKRNGKRHRICRECQRLRMERKRQKPDFKVHEAEKMRQWRKQHPEEYRERYQHAHAEKKQILLDARVDGCIRCSEKHPSCLDFHHRNGKRDKLGHIGVIRRFGINRIYAEITKCDVLCANCHRKLHWDERQNKSGNGG